MELTDFLGTYDEIENMVMDGKLYKDAKSSIESALTKSSMSDEKRALLLQQFTTQIALGFPQMFMSQAMAFHELSLELEVKTANRELVELQKLERKASIRKQLGYKIEDGELVDETDGLIDKQIEGFDKDMFYKIYKGGLENSSMLAQNDVVTPVWVVNAIKESLKQMSDNKIAPTPSVEENEAD
jgi:hypothetical protein